MIGSKIQREILSKCSFFEKGARYFELRPEEVENDLFNYHLQELVKKGFLNKLTDKYTITLKGKSFVTNVDEKDLQTPPTYKVSVYLCPVKGNKIILTRRLKHPQYGYVGLIAEKKRYGEQLEDTAKRALLEETGLVARNANLIGNLHQIRKNDKGEVVEDGIFYIFFIDKFTGNLIEKSVEGEYFWVDLDEVKEIKKIFKPSLEVVINELQERLSNKKDWEDKFIYEFLPEPEDY